MSTSLYISYLERDNTASSDYERKSMFWILSHSKGLALKIDSIYDFNENQIKPECIAQESDHDFSPSEKSLIRLAYNLFNNFTDDHSSPLDVLSSLDDQNFEVSMKAIRIRFNKINDEK